MKRPFGLIAFLSLGCATGSLDTPVQVATPVPTNDPQFHARLLDIAQNYESFGRLDTEFRGVPVDCSTIGSDAGRPVKANVSASKDSSTHGRKLYSLFVKEVPGISYTIAGRPNAIGQVVVKEAWNPEEIEDDGRELKPVVRKGKVYRGFGFMGSTDAFLPYARIDGRLYHAKSKAELFIMYKMDPNTPGTDNGWVYGTVSPDGKTVTSAGKVQSCMKCHKDAPYDRLFGLPTK